MNSLDSPIESLRTVKVEMETHADEHYDYWDSDDHDNAQWADVDVWKSLEWSQIPIVLKCGHNENIS